MPENTSVGFEIFQIYLFSDISLVDSELQVYFQFLGHHFDFLDYMDVEHPWERVH